MHLRHVSLPMLTALFAAVAGLGFDHGNLSVALAGSAGLIALVSSKRPRR